jgi:hypothetical protein
VRGCERLREAARGCVGGGHGEGAGDARCCGRDWSVNKDVEGLVREGDWEGAGESRQVYEAGPTCSLFLTWKRSRV